MTVLKAMGKAQEGGTATFRSVVAAHRERARLESEHIAGDARACAERLVESARREADAIRDRAHAEGYERGVRVWARAALEVAEAAGISRAQSEADCVRLAVEIARQIVGSELATNARAIGSIAERACAALRRDGMLVVRISALDAANASDVADRLRASHVGAETLVRIEVDESLAPGDCVAECAGVRVDGRLETQLAAIADALVGREENGDGV